MKKQQSGFTLIELVMVIVILGILAATALPKFAGLQAEAYDAQEKAVAASLTSWAAMNYGQRLASNGVNGTAITAANAAAICGTINGSLTTYITTDITGITVAAGAGACAGGAGDLVTCTVTQANGTANNATASLICTG